MILMPSNYVQMSNIYFFPFHIKMSITQCNKNSITEAFVPDRNHNYIAISQISLLTIARKKRV